MSSYYYIAIVNTVLQPLTHSRLDIASMGSKSEALLSNVKFASGEFITDNFV